MRDGESMIWRKFAARRPRPIGIRLPVRSIAAWGAEIAGVLMFALGVGMLHIGLGFVIVGAYMVLMASKLE